MRFKDSADKWIIDNISFIRDIGCELITHNNKYLIDYTFDINIRYEDYPIMAYIFHREETNFSPVTSLELDKMGKKMSYKYEEEDECYFFSTDEFEKLLRFLTTTESEQPQKEATLESSLPFEQGMFIYVNIFGSPEYYYISRITANPDDEIIVFIKDKDGNENKFNTYPEEQFEYVINGIHYKDTIGKILLKFATQTNNNEQ